MYEYTYDDGANMITKVTPWSDIFSDASIDDGWSKWGTWLVENAAAHHNAGGNATIALGVTPDDYGVTFSEFLSGVA